MSWVHTQVLFWIVFSTGSRDFFRQRNMGTFEKIWTMEPGAMEISECHYFRDTKKPRVCFYQFYSSPKPPRFHIYIYIYIRIQYIFFHPDNLWVSLRISSNDNRFWWMFFSVFRWCFPWWLSAHLAGKLTTNPWDFITVYHFADRPKRTLDKPSSFNIICHTPLTSRAILAQGKSLGLRGWPKSFGLVRSKVNFRVAGHRQCLRTLQKPWLSNKLTICHPWKWMMVNWC